jgi:hypothetical protein
MTNPILASKEWAVICRELAAGRQMVLLRKGGIREPAKGFGVEHREFFLFPTPLSTLRPPRDRPEGVPAQDRDGDPGRPDLHRPGLFVISELKQVSVDATLKQIESAQWHPLATRRQYEAGPNLTGIGPDDPDANFHENYACGSPRNYTRYCDEQVMKMIDPGLVQTLPPLHRIAATPYLERLCTLGSESTGRLQKHRLLSRDHLYHHRPTR